MVPRTWKILKQLQSAKILLLSPKYEIIMVQSNHPFFQYCYRNIGLSSIALVVDLKGEGEKITVNFRYRFKSLKE